ncbi:MAG: type III-A CRISPR-associated protein Csm2 [Candidatus Muiribacteriaceae bacterium]
MARKRPFESLDLLKAGPEEIVRKSENNAKIWKLDYRDISMTQVRKFFSEVKRIDLKKTSMNEEDIKRELIYLKPTLAYQAGRIHFSNKAFFKHMIDNIDNILKDFSKEKFSKFLKYIESMISFYKFEGGK